jgi:hypothetical protein
MKERYIIGIETAGFALLGSALIYSLGVVVSAAIIFSLTLIVTAQIVKPR